MDIGVDIVQISRIKEKKDLAFRILSQQELLEYQSRAQEQQAIYLAGRFAAKEAILKVLEKPLGYQKIEILNDFKGKPYVNNLKIKISISHEEEYAVAVALNLD